MERSVQARIAVHAADAGMAACLPHDVGAQLRMHRMKELARVLSLSGLFMALAIVGARAAAQQAPTAGRKVYSSAGHPNSKGVDFRIEYPATWLAKEGRHPNIVQSLVSNDGRGLEMCVLLVRALPTNASAEEIDEAFSADGLRSMAPPGARFISGTRTRLDGLPAAALRISGEVENAGTRVRQEAIHYLVIWKDRIITLQFSVGDKLDAPQEATLERFSKFEPQFRQIANSFVLNNRWR